MTISDMTPEDKTAEAARVAAELDAKEAVVRDAVREQAILLRESHALHQQADQIMLTAITHARTGHALPWSRIGALLGVTYQRVHQKWAPLTRNVPSPVTPDHLHSPNRTEGEPLP